MTWQKHIPKQTLPGLIRRFGDRQSWFSAANQGKKLTFIRRRQELEPITCPHPSLEFVLNDISALPALSTICAARNKKLRRDLIALV
jgi:hypothetical protein